jgi:hypothetical protein
MSNLLGVGDQTIGQIQESLGKKIDTSGLPALQGTVKADPMAKAGIVGGTDINTKLNTAGLQQLNDPTMVRQQAMDEAYKNFSSRFDPVAERQQEQMRARIANMGGVTSSDASKQQTRAAKRCSTRRRPGRTRRHRLRRSNSPIAASSSVSVVLKWA